MRKQTEISVLESLNCNSHSYTLFSPFNNPTETYRYYSLPFCHIHEEEEEGADVTSTSRRLQQVTPSTGHYEGAIKHGQRLGQSLVGDARETSPYKITFLDNIDWRLLCPKTYTVTELHKFKNAISNYYFFEMFIEDIPMWVRKIDHLYWSTQVMNVSDSTLANRNNSLCFICASSWFHELCRVILVKLPKMMKY